MLILRLLLPWLLVACCSCGWCSHGCCFLGCWSRGCFFCGCHSYDAGSVAAAPVSASWCFRGCSSCVCFFLVNVHDELRRERKKWPTLVLYSRPMLFLWNSSPPPPLYILTHTQKSMLMQRRQCIVLQISPLQMRKPGASQRESHSRQEQQPLSHLYSHPPPPPPPHLDLEDSE